MVTFIAPEIWEIRALVGAAFANDPMFRWIFPDDAGRVVASTAWLSPFVDAYAEQGHLDVIRTGGEIVAAALWRMPSTAALEFPQCPTGADLLVALVGPERASVVLTALGVFAPQHPREPHAHLHLLAVHPDHQGQGLGHQVIRLGIDAAAQMGLGVHLETTNPRNLPFYRSVGFEVTADLALAPDGPPAWALYRPVG